MIAALVAAALLAVAAPASTAPPAAQPQAGPVVDDEQVVVPGDGVRAVVTRAPFGLQILDDTGRTVLATVPGSDGSGPGAGVEPDPGGGENLPDGARYAPLVAEFGGGVAPQFPAGPYVGNLLLGASAGLQLTSTDVTDVTVDGDAVELTVATDGGTGRTFTVRIAPDLTGTMALDVVSAGASAVAVSFASGPDESFHGFGGRHNSTDQRGQNLVQHVNEQNQSAGPLQPVVTPLPGTQGEDFLFPNGPTAAYDVQNSFISSRPYGFFLDHDPLATFRLATDRTDAWQVDAAGEAASAVVAVGEPATVMKSLADITGRHRLPPEWAQGQILYRGVRVLSAEADDAESYEAKVRDDLEQIDRTGLDVSGYALEGWALLSREVLQDLIDELRARDIKPLVYFRCYIAQDPAGTERPETFPEAVQEGYLVRNEAGTPFLFGSTFVAGVAGLLDVTNPEAVAWYQGRVREVLEMGAEGFMQDFGEQVFFDMRFADGSSGVEMHNRYPVDFHRITRELLDDFEADNPERDVWFFTRAGFSGRPGASAFEGANFPGDNTTDFSRSSGLPSIVPDMLNRQVLGRYGYTADIGGYLDFTTGSPTAELFTRWAQATALTPFFRVHNSSSTGTRMPFSYDDATLERYRGAAELHDRAAPLTRRLWAEASETGVPPIRPMWLASPELEGARQNRDQWLLGDDVLVAPVLDQGATGRSVLFPAGGWQREGTGAPVTGPVRADVPASLDQLPWYTRCGSDPFGDARATTPAEGAGVTPAPSQAVTASTPPARAASTVTANRSLPATGAAPFVLAALLLMGAGAGLRRWS